MANILAAAAGDFHDTGTWIGGVVPGVGDNAYTNNCAITITQDVTCDLISNRAENGATLGGTLVCATTGLTITAAMSAGNTTLLTVTATIDLNVVGNPLGGNANNIRAITWSSAGTLTVTGDPQGGATGSAAAVANNHTSGVVNIVGNPTGANATASLAVTNLLAGTLNVTGNCTGGNFAGSVGVSATAGVVNIVGDCTGGNSTNAYGCSNTISTVNITGNVNGGGTTSYGAYQTGAGTINISGTATGAETGASGALNNATGTINLKRAKGNSYGPTGAATVTGYGAVNNNVAGVLIVEEVEYGPNGMVPTLGVTFFKDVVTNKCLTRNLARDIKTLSDPNDTAGLVPAEEDVRAGVVYAGGVNTGTCEVPVPASVAAGVPVDDTVGTAVVTVDGLASVVGQLLSDALTP